jgi:hypothetical protein
MMRPLGWICEWRGRCRVGERVFRLVRTLAAQTVRAAATRPTPAEITGAIERFVFGGAFALVPVGEAGTGALAWLALKQVPFWRQPMESLSLSDRDEHPHRAAQSLLMSFVSLALAAAVGLVFHELLIETIR